MYYKVSTIILIIFMLLFLLGVIFILTSNIKGIEKFTSNQLYDIANVRKYPLNSSIKVIKNKVVPDYKDQFILDVLTSETMTDDTNINELYYITSSYVSNNYISTLFKENTSNGITLTQTGNKDKYILVTYLAQFKFTKLSITFNTNVNNYENKIILLSFKNNEAIRLNIIKTILDNTISYTINNNIEPYVIDRLLIGFHNSITTITLNNISIYGIPINTPNKTVVEQDIITDNSFNILGPKNKLPGIDIRSSKKINIVYNEISQNRLFNGLIQVNKPWAMYYAGNVINSDIVNNKYITEFKDVYSRKCRNAIIYGDFVKSYDNIRNINKNGKIHYIKGNINTQIIFPYQSLPKEYTICAITKYTNPNTNRNRILSSYTDEIIGPNWLLGHWDSRSLVCYNDRWLSPKNDKDNNTDWIVSCATSGIPGDKSYVIMNNNIYENSYSPIKKYGNNNEGTLTINKFIFNEQKSDFGISYLIIWDKSLSKTELLSVYDVLDNYLDSGEELDYHINIPSTKGPLGSCNNPGSSAKEIKEATNTNTDGIYWIYMSDSIGAKPVYCIMNSECYGGGWMLAMKGAKNKTTFMFNNPHWTTDSVLNENFLSRNNGTNNEDAKFHVFNECKINDCLAIFNKDDVNGNENKTGYGYTWYEPNIIKEKQSLLNYFKNNNCYINYFGDKDSDFSHYNQCENNNRDRYTYTSSSDKNTARNNFITDNITNKYKEGIWSNQKEFMAYGLNIRPKTTWGHSVRWGGTFNENPGSSRTAWYMGDRSNDVSGGIGLESRYSSGDYIGCCESSRGTASSMRFEWYVR